MPQGYSPRRSPPSPKRPTPVWLGPALILAAFGLIWMVWQADSEKGTGAAHQASKRPDLVKIEKVVNKHLIMTNKKIELEQEKARLEHLAEAPSVGDQVLPRTRPNTLYGVDHSSDRNELNAARDLSRQRELNLHTPDAVIQSELADSDAISERERRFREEYARQFIANARAAGYEIELDDNFVVKSVKRLRPNTNPRLFQGVPSVAH